MNAASEAIRQAEVFTPSASDEPAMSMAVIKSAGDDEPAQLSAEALETKLRARERELAEARFESEYFDSLLKAKRKEFESLFLAETTQLRAAVFDSAQKSATLKTETEKIAADLFLQLKREGRMRKTLTDAIQIKEESFIDFSVITAREYVIKHGLTQFLDLNLKEFEKAAPGLKLEFVTQGKTPKVTFSKDMAGALNLDAQAMRDRLEQRLSQQKLKQLFDSITGADSANAQYEIPPAGIMI